MNVELGASRFEARSPLSSKMMLSQSSAFATPDIVPDSRTMRPKNVSGRPPRQAKIRPASEPGYLPRQGSLTTIQNPPVVGSGHRARNLKN